MNPAARKRKENIMEVQRTSIGDITYNGRTFKNITEQVRVAKVPDGVTPAVPGIQDWTLTGQKDCSPKKLLADGSHQYRVSGVYCGNVEMTADAKAINMERDAAINQFLDGNMSQDELANTFEHLLNKFRNACNVNSYLTPLGLGRYEDEGMSEAFYSDFRASILKLAVQRNDEEGKQYITGEIDTQRNWKYYNSDYYYMTEDALAALDKGLEQFLEHVDIKDYKLDIPDYKAEGRDNCYNFNSAWSAYMPSASWYGEADQFMKDYDAVPPKGFEWFYQSGGDAASCLAGQEIHWRLGEGTPALPTHIPFDENDPYSASTWAAYRDSNGVRHMVSTDFAYDDSKNDIKTVSSLLKFTGNKKEDAVFNRFLSSLQVCAKGHYRRFDMDRAIELWA